MNDSEKHYFHSKNPFLHVPFHAGYVFRSIQDTTTKGTYLKSHNENVVYIR